MERVNQSSPGRASERIRAARARIIGDREAQARVVLDRPAVRGRVIDKKYVMHDRIVHPLKARDLLMRGLVAIDRAVRSYVIRPLNALRHGARPHFDRPQSLRPQGLRAHTVRERVEARRTRTRRMDQAVNVFEEYILQQPPLAAPRIRRKHARLALPPAALEFLVVSILAVLFVLVGMPALRDARMKMAARAQASSPASAPAAATEAPALPVTGVKAPRSLVRILILGSDIRKKDRSFRTDVIMLVTVDAEEHQVSILSFPRDLIAKIPGYGEDRINTIMGHGGFKLMQDTLEQNYGARPQYYFLTNFDGFAGMINSIGGIEVNAAQHLEDSCDLPQSRAGICTIEPGVHAMDGATALWYVRSRHTSSDFDRLRRTQEVMAGLFMKFMDMNAVYRLPQLYAQYREDVETNMDVAHIISLLPTALQLISDPGRIHRYAVSHEQAGDYWTAQGAQVLLPDYEAIRNLVTEASFGKK